MLIHENTIEVQENESWIKKVEEIAEKAASSQGCFLYHLEVIGQGSGRTLRVFIDKKEGSGIDDCARVSRDLNELLDSQEALVPGGSYHLEVSTPGIDRVLVKPWHFEKVIGKKIWLKLLEPMEAFGVQDPRRSHAKQIEVILEKVGNGCLSFREGDLEVHVPFEKIEKSKVVFDMSGGASAPQKKSSSKKKK
jgi:ribosome maturation factor RimP